MTDSPPCPVCTARETPVFFERHGVPVHENMVCSSPAEARGMPRGEMILRCCHACGFVFNETFEPELVYYNTSYDNTQTHSTVFNKHVDDVLRDLVVERGVRDCVVVEIGCGKGDFIRRLVEHPGSDVTGYGFDPTYEGPESDLGGRLRFERRFYDPGCERVKADVVIARHMIEHVSDPVRLLRVAHRALAGSSGARIFVETRSVAWALRNMSPWDLVYETCSYFTSESLGEALRVAGFEVRSCERRFGRQYILAEAVRSAAPVARQPAPDRMIRLTGRFGREAPGHVARWRSRLEALARSGGIAIWGAGTKGMAFANMVDPGCKRIALAVDLNPRKHGAFLPGTGHPIMPPAALREHTVRTAIVVNPNYLDEVRSQLASLDLSIDVIAVTDGDLGAQSRHEDQP